MDSTSSTGSGQAGSPQAVRAVPVRSLVRRRVLTHGAILIFLFAGASFAHASATSGTIDSAHKYAWSPVAGYVNFAPANGGLTITDSAITGYAWGANTGWINFSASQSHVTNDGNGTLGGFAWDSGAGWVSFTGVTIDSSGLFHGLATGGTVNGASYAINFDCSNCSVVTDWRPASSRPSSGGGCAPGFVWNPATISCVPVAGGPYSPVITTTSTTSPSASSSASTASPLSPASSGVSGKNPPITAPSASGTATNGQGFVSNPSLTSTTTTFNTVSTSSAIHATTTTASVSTPNFWSSMTFRVVGGVLVLALLGLVWWFFF